MDFPAEVQNRINELAEGAELKTLRAAAEKLSENYRAEGAGGKRGAASKTDVIAYAAVRMAATFAAVSKALELSLSRFNGEINSVLDVGAGTGAGTIAAAQLTGCENIICVEREENMLALGRELCGAADVPAVWEKGDISEGIEKRADLVICSYCLNELSEARRESALKSLTNAAEKLLVIVEPGTPFSFAEMKRTRQTLIKGGFGIAAPCPHNPHEKECPLPEDDWCHFTARAGRSKLHKLLKNADAPYEDEKFCFIAAARNPEKFTPCERRVLRKPLIQSGMITLRLCESDGVKSEKITKKSPLFKAARKAVHGGEFPLTKGEA